MGWSSWNTFGPAISQAVIIRQADAMVRFYNNAEFTIFEMLNSHWRFTC